MENTTKTKSESDTNARDAVLADIARHSLGIRTIETQNVDSLDFHDLSVWCIKNALIRAYEAGQQNLA